MNLYLISQEVNSDYDTYSDAVVAAESEDEARSIHPSGVKNDLTRSTTSDWTSPENVAVRLIGVATPFTKSGVICSSFHAG
jgi:hypothetical protein